MNELDIDRSTKHLVISIQHCAFQRIHFIPSPLPCKSCKIILVRNNCIDKLDKSIISIIGKSKNLLDSFFKTEIYEAVQKHGFRTSADKGLAFINQQKF